VSSLFSFIKQNVPIVGEVGRHVRLRSAGSYMKGPCPFHKETDASFTVSPDKGIFYCFGCHATGDVVSFVAKIENISPLEAAKQLVESHGLKVPDDVMQSAGSGKSVEEKASYFSVHKCLAQWMHTQLRANKAAYDYVINRGIAEQTIDQYQIGFFPGGNRAIQQLLSIAIKEHILAKDFIEAGVFYEGGKTQLRSPFEDRIVFPITDSMGRFCGFGGRVFVAGDDRPKYYNSKESPFFVKGSILFGYSVAKKSMQERKAVFLVEGYTDCVMMAQYGYTNVVATLGTACTKEHLQLLARLVEVVYVMYDGDAAGRKAMLRLAHLCWQVNLELQVVTLPGGLDPAAYLAQYQALSEVLPQAQDIFTFFVSATASEFAQKSLAEKMRVISEIMEVIGNVADVVKRDLLLQHLSQSTDVPLAALRIKLQEERGSNAPAEQSTVSSKAVSSMAPGEHEELDVQLVAVCFNSFVRGQPLHIPADLLPLLPQRIGELYAIVVQEGQARQGSELFDAVLARIASKEREWFTAFATLHGSEVGEQEFAALLGKIMQQHWKDIVGRMKQEIAKASENKDSERVEELLGKFAQWKEQMQQKGHMLWQKKQSNN